MSRAIGCRKSSTWSAPRRSLRTRKACRNKLLKRAKSSPANHPEYTMSIRRAQIKRTTRETRIVVKLAMDGTGRSSVRTGIAFFDHMLDLFARHAVMDLDLDCRGDLAVDAHHTVEDCGIALGQAFAAALGDKRGIRRYGAGFHPRNPFTAEAYVPMDECLARCVVDFSGRPCLIWRGMNRFAYKQLSKRERGQD